MPNVKKNWSRRPWNSKGRTSRKRFFWRKKMMWPYGLASTFSCTLHISFIRCVKDTQTCIMNDFMLKIWIFLVKIFFPGFYSYFQQKTKLNFIEKVGYWKKKVVLLVKAFFNSFFKRIVEVDKLYWTIGYYKPRWYIT